MIKIIKNNQNKIRYIKKILIMLKIMIQKKLIQH